MTKREVIVDRTTRAMLGVALLALLAICFYAWVPLAIRLAALGRCTF